MKNLLYFFAGIALSTSASAQPQNLDFETWNYAVTFDDPAYNNPTGWICTNRYYGFEEQQFTDRFVHPIDSNAHSGNYALSLFTYYNYMKDAAVQTAAIDYRPTSLKGFYKYEDNVLIPLGASGTLVDTAQVSITLTKWNSTAAKNEIVGQGKFSTHGIVNTFTSFQVDIVYTSAEQPDSVTIYLDPSTLGRYPDSDIQNAAEGGRSVFTIDNLSLMNATTSTGNLIPSKSIAVHPNPAKDFIYFEKLTGDVTITDQTGRLVSQFKLKEQESADISQLRPGIYLLQINNSKGLLTTKVVKW